MARSIRRKNFQDKYPRLQITDFPILKTRIFDGSVPKDEVIKSWLKEYIKSGFENNTISENTLLPLKSKLAYYFGVGEGTVQSAVRKMEDEGIVVSKQRIGTLIISAGSVPVQSMNKLTSKRDKIVEQIKVLIKDNYPVGTMLPTMKELEGILSAKRNTVRAALDFLVLQNYIKPVILGKKEENKLWEVIGEVDKNINADFDTEVHAETLAQKISVKIEDYISQNCKIGSRIEPINVLAKRYNVSDKTVYDALQVLIEKGILQARRGKYGTIVVRMPSDAFQPAKEWSIFMPAAQAAIYSYKRIENLLRNKIISEYSVGERLPSMKDLAAELDVSTNTIRKAIMDLTAEGYLAVSRGKFGGIYVLDIPQESAQSFRWLAVNPQYVKSYK